MSKNNSSNTSFSKKILLGNEDKELEKFDLIKVQKNSWGKFVNSELKQILNEFFPIEDYTGKKFTIHF